jgi:microcystin-dependent protein
MAEPFLSEIRMMSFGFAPRGWALCNGQILPINQNQALFSLLGTTYGGNGQTNFALPDLRGRVPIHMGTGFTLGQLAGQETHTLTSPEMPQHRHALRGSTDPATLDSVPNNLPAVPSINAYGPASSLQPAANGTISNAGSNQPHENMQPFLTISFCIALQGIFPNRN